MQDCKLYVGNLSWSIDDDQLYNLFSSYGEVLSAKIIIDRTTGRSRGFGFVVYKNADQARAAANSMNETMVEGRPLKVNVALPEGVKSPPVGVIAYCKVCEQGRLISPTGICPGCMNVGRIVFEPLKK